MVSVNGFIYNTDHHTFVIRCHSHIVDTQPAAISELPGYLGRRHMRESRYVTADFPREAISTTDQGFAWVWNRQCAQFEILSNVDTTLAVRV